MKTKFVPGVTPAFLFARLGPDEQKVSFLVGQSTEGWSPFLAWHPTATLVYRREQKQAQDVLDHFLSTHTTARIVGYFSYDLGYELYALKQNARDDLQLPDMFFSAYTNYLLFSPAGVTIYYTDPGYVATVMAIIQRAPAVFSRRVIHSSFEPEWSHHGYNAAYQKIKEYIVEGDIYQMNLTHRLKAEVEGSPRQLFLDLMVVSPVDFMAYIEGDGFEILSASPERFVKITDHTIETCPIKGTRPRGATPARDALLKQELMASAKEAAELNMITDLLRNDIGKIATVASVQVVEQRVVTAHPNVWHTHSRIVGELRHSISPADALLSLLPGGSITGCPKKRAMEIIDELEPTTRGVYTGAIGVFAPDKTADFNIAIRTMIRKGPQLYLQVGGGIVYDSQPQAEYQETFDKAGPFLELLQGLL